MDVGGDLRVWALANDGTFNLKASLLFGRNLQETSVITTLGSHLLLLTGGYDSKIHVYATDRGHTSTELRFHFSMLGHFNSVKDLAISPQMDGGALYLASGSQD